MSREDVAILSLACRFPEAASPQELWQNVVEGRRSFRPIPPERLSLAEYDAARVGEVDSIPAIPAGLITDWAFSREEFRVPRSAFEVADLTHWLALDVAAQAIEAAGGAEVLPRSRTAVIFGNTLTGEFTRSAQIRLRAPYLERKLAPILGAQGLDSGVADDILAQFAQAVADDFPDPNEETLAGALANTIAGRIANHFDLGGGAWTVDGACASSLLALADACGRIAGGELEVAIVGGVDLSLDPFELVGFARAGALALDEMRVFDRRAAGFWPGEGCGVAVLAGREVASRIGAEPLSWIRGWGLSTDGAGGLTRPTIAGQERALHRAWTRAGAAPSEAGLFEAHGTGTAVGDPTEIRALAGVVGENRRRIPVGSIKANVGHCKAAAGMAGLMKVVMAQTKGIIPPHISCEEPNPVFAETNNRLAPAEVREWQGARLCGVSGFGFGGVNAHIVLDAPQSRRTALPHRPRPQDGEVFAFSAPTREALLDRLQATRDRSATLSLGEITDLAAAAAQTVDEQAPYRAAVVAGSAAELGAALDREIARLDANPAPRGAEPRIGFLFPGQAAPVRGGNGVWARRFPEDADLSRDMPAAEGEGNMSTDIAQPAIVAASLIGLRRLAGVGIRAEAVAGHSLGEVTALGWAGALDEADCLALARYRGRIMADHGAQNGAMALLRCDAITAVDLAEKHGLSVACFNGTEETVLAGPAAAVGRLVEAEGAERLRVSHAFHSPDMKPAATPLAAALEHVAFRPPQGRLMSTVTGGWLNAKANIPEVLVTQLTAPVRFAEALDALAQEVDLVVEVGPGAGLTRLAQSRGLACLAVDSCGDSFRPLLDTIAELWRRGAMLEITALFADRPARPISMKRPRFLANPCGSRTENADRQTATPIARRRKSATPRATDAPSVTTHGTAADALSIVRMAVADELGLPVDSVPADARLLDDLHLNSLSVGRIVGAAAARLGVATPTAITDLSVATSEGIAAHLTEIRDLGKPEPSPTNRVEGVAPWVAQFERVDEPAQWPQPATEPIGWRAFELPNTNGAQELPLSQKATGALVFVGADEAPANRCDAAVALWRAAKDARTAGLRHLAIVHRAAGVEGFARSLIADGVFDSAMLIDTSRHPDDWADVARLLATGPRGFAAWRLAPDRGLMRDALQRVTTPATSGPAEFSADDTALVVGGARGIGAECALRLADRHGVSLSLVGRSAPDDPTVAETLKRANALNVRASYRKADATDPHALHEAVAAFTAEGLGPTIALHAAGLNRPAAFDDLDEAALAETIAPKLAGLEALLDALDQTEIKLVLGFGSIIGALGLAGETHYALANGMMSERLVQWGGAQGVRTLALDWSVWAGAGMGERLGAVERLRMQGVDAIPLEAALDRFERLIDDTDSTGRQIVTSRFGPTKHVRFAAPEPPQLRFLETRQVFVPQVELVADTALSPGADPWLEDHKIDGKPIVPGVVLLEAAAQAALAVTGQAPTGFEQVEFRRAVAVPPDGLTLRTAVLVDEGGQVNAVLRASDDDFAAERARALVTIPVSSVDCGKERVARDGSWPADDLYGPLFFNAGRFRRLSALERVSAFSMRATLDAVGDTRWFGAYQPQRLVLADPGARDAGLHMLQACVPQRRVLPISVARIVRSPDAGPPVVVEAIEQTSDSNRFCFDIVWRDGNGAPVETWVGAEFQAVDVRPIHDLPQWLLPAALERAVASVSQRRDVRAVMELGARCDARRRRALDRLGVGDVTRRLDGAPEVPNGPRLSLTHTEGTVFAATAGCVLGIDHVAASSPCANLAAEDADLATRIGAAHDWPVVAATAAVWAAREALRKAGALSGAPLLLETDRAVGGALLRCAGLCVVCLRNGQDGCVALAFPRDDEPADRRPKRARPAKTRSLQL